jgi:anti-sigma-K factor RskA
LSNWKHTPWTSAFALTGAAATVVPLTAMTPAAQAKVAPEPLVAKTLLHDRLDSGANGYWAYDNFTRTLILTYLGKPTDRARGKGST